MSNMTASERRTILANEYREALRNITPNMPGRHSGQQLAAAKGIARKRAQEIIEGREYEAMVAAQIAENVANYTDEERESAAAYQAMGF